MAVTVVCKKIEERRTKMRSFMVPEKQNCDFLNNRVKVESQIEQVRLGGNTFLSEDVDWPRRL